VIGRPVRELARTVDAVFRATVARMLVGVHALRTEPDAAPDARTAAFMRNVRAVGVAVLAGGLAGALVFGLGARVVMRFSGVLAGPELQGTRTANFNVVGNVTVGGTISLIIGGVSLGIYIGLFYAVARPWLSPLGRWQPLVTGALTLAVFGTTILTPLNRDFVVFGPAIVNVVLFAALFVGFGALLASWVYAMDGTNVAMSRPPRIKIGPLNLTPIVGLALAMGALLGIKETVGAIVLILGAAR
jgi:hypothetical protein